MLGLYGDEEGRFGLVTDIDDERELAHKFCAALAAFMREFNLDDSLELRLVPWIKSYTEVVLKMRGYKADVRTKTIMEVGEFTPGESSLAVSVDSKGKVMIPETRNIST